MLNKKIEGERDSLMDQSVLVLAQRVGRLKKPCDGWG